MQKFLYLTIALTLVTFHNSLFAQNNITVFNGGCQASVTSFSCTSGANINLDSRDVGGCTYASGIHCANIGSSFTFTHQVSSKCNYNLDFTKGIIDVALKDNNVNFASVYLDNNCKAKVCYNGLCDVTK